MLGLLLIYFIGKNYMGLAEEYNKAKWLFAILGVVVYYVGTFIGGFIIGMIMVATNPGAIDTTHDLVWSLMGLPFGIGATVGFYFILKKQWSKSTIVNAEILDQE